MNRTKPRQKDEWLVVAALATCWDDLGAAWKEGGVSADDFRDRDAKTALLAVLKAAEQGGDVMQRTMVDLSETEATAYEKLDQLLVHPDANPFGFKIRYASLKRAVMEDKKRQAMEAVLRAKKRGEDTAEADKALADMLAGSGEGGKKNVRRFHVVSVGELMENPPPPRKDIIGEAVVFAGATTALIGAGGTGKSRLVTQWAIHSLLGIPFGGWEVPRLEEGKSWLLVTGNENSQRRIFADVSNMMEGLELSQEQREVVRTRLFVQLVENDDLDLSAGNIPLLTDAVKETNAAVVVLDPFGDCIDGDGNNDTDVRRTISLITKAVRMGNPDAAVLIVHHSRDGAGNMKQAKGYDKGKFGKGSKSLRNACRSVIHVVKSQEEEDVVVFTAGKCNDAREFEQFAMRLTDNLAYAPAPDFDIDAMFGNIQSEAEGKGGGGSGQRGRPRKFTPMELVAAIREKGWVSWTSKGAADEFGVSKRTMEMMLSQLVEDGELEAEKPKDPTKPMVFTYAKNVRNNSEDDYDQ